MEESLQLRLLEDPELAFAAPGSSAASSISAQAPQQALLPHGHDEALQVSVREPVERQPAQGALEGLAAAPVERAAAHALAPPRRAEFEVATV